MNKLALTLLATTLPMAGLTGVSSAADRALVVGIDAYPLAELAQPLQQASADARRFQKFLVNQWDFPVDGVKLLENQGATSYAIMTNMIDILVGETAPGDRVVFYFAGLGSRIPALVDGGADDLENVLLAYDVDSILGKIPQSTITDILDIIANRDVTVIIDASFESDNQHAAHSDATVRGANLAKSRQSVDQSRIAHLPFGSGVADRNVWNAAAPGQFAWETQDGGAFTTAMIAGFENLAADADRNGTVTNAELLGFVSEHSRDWCAANSTCAATGRGLDPQFSGTLNETVGPLQSPELLIAESLDTSSVVVSAEPVTYQETLGFVTDLFAPSNDANLVLSINGNQALRLGDIVNFAADSDGDGTLILFDVNPNGELAQIFPSILSTDGDTRMSAGETLIVPNGLGKNGQPLQIRISEPAGRGFLLGLLVADELPALQAVLDANLDGGPVPNAGRYLYEIAQELLKAQADTSGNIPLEWSATYLPYEITR